MSILDKLFSGEIYPSENFKLNSAEYKSVNKEIDKYMEKLKKKLTTEDVNLLENDLWGAICTENSIVNSYYFSCGFKLATLIMGETFYNHSGLFDDNEREVSGNDI